MIKTLIDNGEDPFRKNNEGETFIDLIKNKCR